MDKCPESYKCSWQEGYSTFDPNIQGDWSVLLICLTTIIVVSILAVLIGYIYGVHKELIK